VRQRPQALKEGFQWLLLANFACLDCAWLTVGGATIGNLIEKQDLEGLGTTST
jgi:hypothetical protein